MENFPIVMSESYHIAVLLDESVEGLNIQNGGTYVDVTFGGGGHSAKILEELEGGRLIAFDQDQDAHDACKINDSRLSLLKQNFRFLKNNLRAEKALPVDGILADLGVSSHQFDEGPRGFSFRSTAELDMRMNQLQDKSAETVINDYSEEELLRVFKSYGEIPGARRLVRFVIEKRNKGRISTTFELSEIVERAFGKHKANQKLLAQVFQAIRIEVNDEMKALEEFLGQAIEVLKEGGRLSVISYHSLEDRLVKNFIRAGRPDGQLEKDAFGRGQSPMKAINKKVIVPGENEIKANSRARSAKLRIAEKVAA